MLKYAIRFVCLVLLLVVTGCTTLPSADNVFENNYPVDIDSNKEVEASVSLEEAIAYTESDMLKRYWFRAYVASNIEKRRVTHMTRNGIVVQPHGFYMNNSFITKPYDYYQWDNESYIRMNNNWFRGREQEVPFEPTFGFGEWQPLLGQAEIIGEDTVLSIPTTVHQIELSGQELIELESPLLQGLSENIGDELAPLLEQTNIRVLFYVGQPEKSTDDIDVLPVIYKFQTWIQMPIPGAGYMEQEIQHFIFRVNEESVEMIDVEQIERFLIEIDTSNEQMEEELEQLEENIEQLEKETDSESNQY